MKATEQGVPGAYNPTHDRGHLSVPFVRIWLHLLLLLTSLSFVPCNAEGVVDNTDDSIDNLIKQETLDTAPSTLTRNTTPKSEKHTITIVYSPQSKLQTAIFQRLVQSMSHVTSNIDVTSVTDQTTHVPETHNPELIITLGSENNDKTRKYFKDNKQLLVTSNTADQQLSISSDNARNAVLFMTQPYCRQFKFIRAINKNWNSISMLSSHNDTVKDSANDSGKGTGKSTGKSTSKIAVDNNNVQICAKSQGLTIHNVRHKEDTLLSIDIKEALYHSDLLLATPDTKIYNSRSVKNILLTSYRLRKPVIAFSKSFVDAGALAAIHSTPEQIVASIEDLVNEYFKNDQHFSNKINFPKDFDISFNKQVFRALGLPLPMKQKIKNILNASKTSGAPPVTAVSE